MFIFGSWARRFHGEPGPPPNDIDIAVVSDTLSRFQRQRTASEPSRWKRRRTATAMRPGRPPPLAVIERDLMTQLPTSRVIAACAAKVKPAGEEDHPSAAQANLASPRSR